MNDVWKKRPTLHYVLPMEKICTYIVHTERRTGIEPIHIITTMRKTKIKSVQKSGRDEKAHRHAGHSRLQCQRLPRTYSNDKRCCPLYTHHISKISIKFRYIFRWHIIESTEFISTFMAIIRGPWSDEHKSIHCYTMRIQIVALHWSTQNRFAFMIFEHFSLH